MEDVRGWNATQRQQTARGVSVNASSLSPSPLPLRPHRSATHLRQNFQQLPPPPLPSSQYPDDDRLLPTPPPYEARRAQSLSGLSGGYPSSSAATSVQAKELPPSKWKSALGEAQFMAGSLFSKPAESTKHYSIIRHSHGLVWYKGPKTSVSITILADAPLPADRTVWLQEKGYSGNLGMSVKAFMGARGHWIDVTPVQEAQAEHVPDVDERGIQRDIKRFLKKASGKVKNHSPRETHILRIPAAASDGYFRLVLCGGQDSKKTLCGSPVFRIASTSTDAAVVRGASLSTLPIEMGVKVASTIGSQVAKTYTGIAGSAVQDQAGKILPGQSVMTASTAAYKGYHGVGGRGLEGAVQDSWRKNRQGSHGRLIEESGMGAALDVIGSDDGPETPFPIKFDGRVVRGTGRSLAELGIPTANLKEVPEDVKLRLGGAVYAAWAMVLPGKGDLDPGLPSDWHEAIVTVAAQRGATPSVVTTNSVAVHVTHDFNGISLVGCRLRILLMGCLHAAALPAATAQELLAQHERDVYTALASLGRDAWVPQQTLSRMETLKSQRSFGDRLHDATGKVQQQVDKIPLHWAGVRSDSGTARDLMYGTGGIWIRR